MAIRVRRKEVDLLSPRSTWRWSQGLGYGLKIPRADKGKAKVAVERCAQFCQFYRLAPGGGECI
jgi:hypothetical protein